jgi:hypothetical protein
VERKEIMGKANPRLDAWRRSFHYDPDLHPERRELSSLEDILERVGAALGYVQALDNPTLAEKQEAVAIAGMAIDYVERVYAHLHWSDGPAVPKPTNLGVAKMVLENLLGDAHQKRALRWLASDDDALEEKGQAEATGEGQEQRSTPAKPIPTDEANILVRKYVEGHPGAPVKKVAEALGISTGRVAQSPAWQAEMGRRRANKYKPSEKPARPLTKKMLESIGRDDDPAARLEAEEAVFRNLVEKAGPDERARLMAMKEPEKRKLIEAASSQFADDLADSEEHS